MGVLSDEYRVASVLMAVCAVGLAVSAHLCRELYIPAYLGTAGATFMAANYWCGFPYHGWWKRRNLWR
jgi:hypothetical protein